MLNSTRPSRLNQADQMARFRFFPIFNSVLGYILAGYVLIGNVLWPLIVVTAGIPDVLGATIALTAVGFVGYLIAFLLNAACMMPETAADRARANRAASDQWHYSVGILYEALSLLALIIFAADSSVPARVGYLSSPTPTVAEIIALGRYLSLHTWISAVGLAYVATIAFFTREVFTPLRNASLS